MHQATIKRPSPEEINTNTQLLKTFEKLFSSKNYYGIMDLFHREGSYFDRFTYPVLMPYFFAILQSRMGLMNVTGPFSKVIHERQSLYDHICIGINHGFSTDYQPGQVVVEFRFGVIDPFCHEEQDPSITLLKKLGEPADRKIAEAVFRFALTFKDGKIFTLRHPKKYAENPDRFLEEN